MSRAIDADALTKRLVEFCNKNCPCTAKTRKVMCGLCLMGLALEAVEDAPTIEPEPKWKRLMMHLADLQLTYSPNWGANGCGDQKLYEFVTGLIDELQGWKEGE